MSRLRALHIPFVQGFSDEVDAKVLPDGVLRDLRNARIDRSGSVRLRRGWRPVDMSVQTSSGVGGADREVRDLYSTGATLVGLTYDTGAPHLQTYVAAASHTPWVVAGGAISPITRVKTRGNLPTIPADVIRATAAVTSDGVFGAVLAQTSAKSYLRVFRMDNDDTIYLDDFSAAGDSNPRKVVSIGEAFGIVDSTGSALRLRTLDPRDVASLSSAVTLVSVAASHFDVSVATATAPTALHVVYTVSGEVSYAQFDFDGDQVGSTKQIVASGARSAYVASDDVTAHVVYQAATGGELSLLSFAATDTFTTSAGPTALDAGVDILNDAYAIGYAGASAGRNIAATVDTPVRQTNSYVVNATHTSITKTVHESSALSCGWLVSQASAGFGVSRGVATQLDAVFLDESKIWAVPSFSLARLLPTGAEPYRPGLAPTGDALVLYPIAAEAARATSLGEGALRAVNVASRACRVMDDSTRRHGAAFDGGLYISGGVLTQYYAGGVVENGMLQPALVELAESNGSGSIANGEYSYRTVVTWRDEGGRRHFSPVSAPLDITTTGANDTVTATVHVAKTLRRAGYDATMDPVVELYRTEAGPGELYYLVASAVADITDDEVTVVDTSADAAIVDNRRLYTEGEFGAVSGVLDVAPADASAFVAPVRDRLVLGGADRAYQVSQITMPEEPAAFTQPGISGPGALVYFDTVEGDLTAVASLDQTIILGTERAIFVTSAEGGPNLAGVGEFPSPARLPSDVGIPAAAADSIVEDAQGLWFLGDAAGERLYLLGRGQSSPVAVLAARDRFAAGTVVGAGVDSRDDVTCWAVDADDPVLVSRHAQAPNPWAVDDLPFTPVSMVAHGGALYASDDTGVVWTNAADAFGDGASGATAVVLQVVTSDAQVFGLAGHGRLAVIEVLGEFQSAATLALEISYDLGLTWDAIGTAFTVSGLTAGEAFQRQWRPARQRAGKFRLRVTMTPSATTAEGCRLTGLSLYYLPATGPTRLDSAKRK